jgi:GDPmannose 4,6-dehydratase
VELLIGDPAKAKQKLGWEPRYTLPMLCKEMVASDVQKLKSRVPEFLFGLMEPF